MPRTTIGTFSPSEPPAEQITHSDQVPCGHVFRNRHGAIFLRLEDDKFAVLTGDGENCNEFLKRPWTSVTTWAVTEYLGPITAIQFDTPA